MRSPPRVRGGDPRYPGGLAEPRSFGRYRVTGTIGTGAMGEGFAAVDEALGREVAIKMLRGNRIMANCFHERFCFPAHQIDMSTPDPMHDGIVKCRFESGDVRLMCYARGMNELEQVGERIAEQAAHLDAAMHRLLADLREFDRRGGWHVQGAESCAHWLAWRVGWDLVTARDHVRVARKLAEFPAIDDALRRGEMSYSKVRAMVRVATPANESLLLDHARLMTASQLEVLCRKYSLVQRHGQDPHPLSDLQRRYVRRRDTEDGMVKIEAVLHPEEAELIWTMLNHAASQLTRESGSAADLDPSNAIACPIDDSAESREVAIAPAGAAGSPVARPTDVDIRPADDSAELCEVALVPAEADGPAVAARPAGVDIRPIDDDSAELPRAMLEMRSLLDRLLDEADALRAAEAVRADELTASASNHELSSSNASASLNNGADRTAERAAPARRCNEACVQPCGRAGVARAALSAR